MSPNHPQPHPWREALYQEAHSRPFPVLSSPALVTHFTLLQARLKASDELAQIIQLADALEGPQPDENSRRYQAQLGRFIFSWQRHFEFSTYCFILPDPDHGFEQSALEFLPEGWLNSLGGEMVTGMHLLIEPYQKNQTTTPERLGQVFEEPWMGSSAREDGALIWSDFRLKDDGFCRYLVQNKTLGPAQTGRLTQRLIELETYRIMAQLAGPLVKNMGPKLDKMEYSMLLISDHIQRIHTIEDQKGLLLKLSAVAADLELMRAYDYRFSASHAYFELASERINELKEVKLPGIMTFGDFLNRRIEPSRRTLRHTRQRINDLNTRIAHARELLQTNINLAIEEQNQSLLSSMEKRSHLQLRLQEAVEGLSIAAISYYTVSLLKLIFGGLTHMGLHFDKDLATGIAVPVVVGTVWLSIHKIKEHVLKKEE
ncbi:MAG: hypothetical protein A2508_07260 [Candidatus Lambdaproteobacteria bacterium RIFOXYD12_FULL_49_8]|uniref:DUF3422 domain-containing protein n=1 Tax=Candidatus Lambdaproteobacteria bacterium RIFOXYD2_FULL_50_16 TaxID=1817772 RepID=A0A1F6GBQ2_9PROT|nr:MAG: hypothetical protein A2527_06840 [Candidatus Lambdaproteobacteria bacterium RIFOXYD2_FULL_50_16]OGG97461.1 MAG: hypothetical protein A2508_07260 [Candidatus Lambdaproteobacteria bacterium RIFOXYD12_FULL_49_8]